VRDKKEKRFFMRLLAKIHLVILSEAKNLMFFFLIKKSKNEILQPYGLRMTRKGKAC
jgi:hypothetical protein